jgi:galactokinase/mevalonate kinase-like predicted kinase
MAAQAATAKVGGMLGEDEHPFAKDLERMGEEAAETERRCTDATGEFDGKKTVILDQARETKHEASEMMKTYLEGETDALDGFEFLTMAEAGEVGHWAILKKLNERAADDRIEELVAWALPIQERHYDTVVNASLALAGDEDPNEAA